MDIQEIQLRDLDVKTFIAEKTRKISSLVGDGTAINALSGGVDSSTVTLLAHRALGPRLTWLTMTASPRPVWAACACGGCSTETSASFWSTSSRARMVGPAISTGCCPGRPLRVPPPSVAARLLQLTGTVAARCTPAPRTTFPWKGRWRGAGKMAWRCRLTMTSSLWLEAQDVLTFGETCMPAVAAAIPRAADLVSGLLRDSNG